jgi:predicted nucleic acid-binding protein
MVIVLDASVLVKLFVDEPLSGLAEAVVQDHALILAPELVRLEVASAITRKARKNELPRTAAETKLGLWREFLRLGNLRLTPDVEILPAAEQLSLELRHPLADCLYLVVAKQSRAPLATADQPFLDALGGRFSHVRHLSSFGS